MHISKKLDKRSGILYSRYFSCSSEDKRLLTQISQRYEVHVNIGVIGLKGVGYEVLPFIMEE